MTYNYAIAVLLIIGLIGCINTKKEKPDPSAEVIREIDKIKLTDLNGQSIHVKEYQGKTIFINFWATWCKPCIRELPTIEEAQKILRDEKIIFLMASNESAEQINEFSNLRKYKLNYVRIENGEEMNVQALPATFIFNPRGDLVFSETGYRNWAEKNNIDLIIKIAKENE
jgi:thiol-disulfide isomerase/thioredoxin